MSEFKKVAIYVDKEKISSYTQAQENRLVYFQQLIDMYNNLNTGVVLEKNDLNAMIQNPKEFVANRLIKDQEVSFGGLKLSLEKVFDIIEKPAGTNELIAKIINDVKEYDLMMNQRNVQYFEIENGNSVVLNAEYLAKITEQNTVYIINEKQAKAYEELKNISKSFNKLNDLKITNHFQELLFDKLLEVNNQTGETKVNPYFTTKIY